MMQISKAAPTPYLEQQNVLIFEDVLFRYFNLDIHQIFLV